MAVGHVSHSNHQVLFAGNIEFLGVCINLVDIELFDLFEVIERFTLVDSDVAENFKNLVGDQLLGAFSRVHFFIRCVVVGVITIAFPHVKCGSVSLGT